VEVWAMTRVSLLFNYSILDCSSRMVRRNSEDGDRVDDRSMGIGATAAAREGSHAASSISSLRKSLGHQPTNSATELEGQRRIDAFGEEGDQVPLASRRRALPRS
jgi:hypothetical protein